MYAFALVFRFFSMVSITIYVMSFCLCDYFFGHIIVLLTLQSKVRFGLLIYLFLFPKVVFMWNILFVPHDILISVAHPIYIYL